MESVKVVEGQRKTRLQAQELQNLHKQSFVIIPYQVSGFIDYTNRGFVNQQVNPDDFETFKRVWTGNDACNISWKGSINLVQNQETKEMEVKFSLGEYFLGLLELNSSENNFDKDKSFSDYTSQEVESTLTFRVDATFEITEYYNFMFFKIPEVSGSTLYRILNIEKDFVGTELIGYVITFKTINQEIANTGRARQQNIMPNAPGQGYLEAEVKDKAWYEEFGKDLEAGVDYIGVNGDRYIVANDTKRKNNPVRKIVVKLYGNAILNSVSCFGRPVLLGDNLDKFRSQRLLFPYNITSASTPNLMNTQNNCASFYFGTFWPTLEYFKDLMESIKDSLTPINEWKYQGWLQYNYNELKETNPLDKGNYKYELFGYLDTSISPTLQRDWAFSTPTKELDMSGSYGLEQLYKVGGNKVIHDHLFDNYWTTKEMKTLPTSTKDTLSFGWTLNSGLGLLMKGGTTNLILGSALFLVGISGTLIEKLKPRKCNGFRGIISASFIDFNNSLFKKTDSDGDKLPFNMLESGTNTPSSIFFDSATLNTAFQGTLTDLFRTKRTGEKILSTLNIGQTLDENGEYILPDQSQLLLNGDAKLLPTYDNYSGYIIDSFKVCAVGNCDISVEFLDINNDVVWSGVYQSESKWTGSMREIWTEKNCSVFGRENVFYNEPVPYPKPIPEPPPSFTTAVEKVIRPEYWYSFTTHTPGAGNFVYGPFKTENQQLTDHSSYWHSYGSAIYQKEFDIELFNNISKAELTQLWGNISIETDWCTPSNLKNNVSIWELFSNPPKPDGSYRLNLGNDISFSKWYVGTKFLASPIPIPFPIGTIDTHIQGGIVIRSMELIYKDNRLFLHCVNGSRYKHGEYICRVVSPLGLADANGKYMIFFNEGTDTWKVGISGIRVIPRK